MIFFSFTVKHGLCPAFQVSIKQLDIPNQIFHRVLPGRSCIQSSSLGNPGYRCHQATGSCFLLERKEKERRCMREWPDDDNILDYLIWTSYALLWKILLWISSCFIDTWNAGKSPCWTEKEKNNYFHITIAYPFLILMNILCL